MKKFQKSFILILVFVFLSTSILVSTAIADETEDINSETSQVETDEQEEQDNGKGKGKGKDKAKNMDELKAWKTAKDAVEIQKDEEEKLKDALEEQKNSLEEQYETAKESGDTVLAENLLVQIAAIKADIEAAKQQMKLLRTQMKEIVRNRYTSEELAELQIVAEEIENSDENATVIPVENIITKGVDIKFDTPPVVKYNRTLVPVRALSEAFNAQVQWIQEDKKIIITKDGKEIILQLDNNIAVINGVEILLDVPAQSVNRRTVVPLRFIVESLGLKLEWDADTGIIEIEEPVEDIVEDTTDDATEDVVTP